MYHLITNGNSILVDDNTNEDVTKEIKEDYGLENLCRNRNAYIYNTNKDDSIVSVTTRKGNLVRIASKSKNLFKYI